jgi:sulfite reductase alpha subunit-like flavoprotein
MSSFDNSSRGISVLYASETGTSEDVAYTLSKTLRSHFPSIPVCTWSLESYATTSLPQERIAIFVVSTTGDGEHPNSMRSFWKFILQKSLPATSLGNTYTTVFGLGDSSYEKYNACARRLAARLRQLGSKELIPIGLGDDSAQMGILGSLNIWTSAILKAVADQNQLKLKEEIDISSIANNDDDEYSVTIVEAPVDDSTDPHPDVHKAVEEYRTLFNDSTEHRPHLQEVERRRLATKGETGTENGAVCGRGAYVSPDVTNCVTLNPFIARVVRNERMTDENWHQNVRNISLDFTCSLNSLYKEAASRGQKMRWPLFQAGDVACIHPKNPQSLVGRALSLVPNTSSSSSGGCHKTDETLQADSFLSIKRITPKKFQGESQRRSRIGNLSCTALQLFTHHIELSGMPRRSFFMGLANFATNEEEEEKLRELAGTEGASLYYEYCQRERRNYVDVMEEFPSARPPLHKLLEMLPLLQPRHYSIASSGYNDHNSALMQLCVAVTTATTPFGRQRVGLCSTYLAETIIGEEVIMWIRRGTFSNPGLNVPLLLIGPGTGVAPMRSLLQERRFLAECLDNSTGLDLSNIKNAHSDPNCLLFYGCRRREYDFLYEHEWTSLSPKQDHDENILDPDDFFCDSTSPTNEAICIAFSQDVAENSPKMYVTHKLRLHGKLVARLVDSGAHIYVAGSANRMPADVRKSIIECLVEHSDITSTVAEAELRVRIMERKKQYLVEAWS